MKSKTRFNLTLLTLLTIPTAVPAEVSLTLGLSTPFNRSQDIYGSNRASWKPGDLIGMYAISTPCGYFSCSLYHYSLFQDSQDRGVTGVGLTKTWTWK